MLHVIRIGEIETIDQLREVVESWLIRVHNLKHWIDNHPYHPKLDKVCEMAADMSTRLQPYWNAYNRATGVKPINYQSGGIAFQSGPEYIELPNGKRVLAEEPKHTRQAMWN